MLIRVGMMNTKMNKPDRKIRKAKCVNCGEEIREGYAIIISSSVEKNKYSHPECMTKNYKFDLVATDQAPFSMTTGGKNEEEARLNLIKHLEYAIEQLKTKAEKNVWEMKK